MSENGVGRPRSTGVQQEGLSLVGVVPVAGKNTQAHVDKGNVDGTRVSRAFFPHLDLFVCVPSKVTTPSYVINRFGLGVDAHNNAWYGE